jgi:AraC-like DNA-binding protein
MRRPDRRRIDWRVTVPGNVPTAKLAAPTMQSTELAALTSALMADPSPPTLDRVLRSAVEFCRTVIGMERASIFLLDAEHRAMIGTWGTDARRETKDEHDVMYDYGDLDREVFARARGGFAWTVYEDCPLTAQSEHQTCILGRGWVACTAILGPGGPLGILFNDTALSHSALDEAKQARAALLCSLLGRALEPCRDRLTQTAACPPTPPHPLVRGVTELLARDPALSCDALAEHFNISTARLTRTFKRETSTSIVDHRNELRLARFLGRVDTRAGNLLEAALGAGFGSYAQFHRVFRARFGQTPREYLLERQR